MPVRVVAADPLPSSYRDLEWDPPAGKTVTAYRVYYTEPGGDRTLYGTYAGNVESVRVADLSPNLSGIVFEVEGDYTSTAVGSAQGSTGPVLASYEPVTFTGLHSDGLTLTGTRTFVLAHKNKLAGPVVGAQIEGLSRLPSHATILGVTIGSGTVNTTNFTATRWEQATRNGSSSWTPSPGAWLTPSWWVTDDALNLTAVPQNGWFLVKIVVDVGAVSVPRWNQGEARIFSADTKSAIADGDYGSTPSLAATSPGAWTTDSSTTGSQRGGPCFTLRLRREAESQADIAFVFGDSLAMGEAGFIYYDRWNSTANSLLTNGRRVVPAGVGQQSTTQIAATYLHWLANSPDASISRINILMGASWNGTVTTPIEQAYEVGLAAGKKMFIYLPSPSALVYNGKGDHANWVAARQRYIDLGYQLIETWPNVTEADGATIKAAMTPDGIHLNTSSGQVVQGTDFATAQEVIFA